jgi:hypothetical protein
MSRDAFGRPFVSRDLVCTAEERWAAIRYRELISAGQAHKLTKRDRKLLDQLNRRDVARLGKAAIKEIREQIARLDKAEQEEAEAAAALKSLPTSASFLLEPEPVKAQPDFELLILPEPVADIQTCTNVSNATDGSEYSPVEDIQPVANATPPSPATANADPPLLGGRSPLSWREPKKNENLGSL